MSGLVAMAGRFLRGIRHAPAWLYKYHWAHITHEGLLPTLDRWTADIGDLPGLVQGALVVVPLLMITLSGVALQRTPLPLLRLLEGYWPTRTEWLREWLRQRLSDRADRDLRRLRDLAKKPVDQLNPYEFAERSQLTSRARRLPPVPAQRMPTRVGNTLRAAEVRARSRYGLDAAACWPRLWLLLPETARQEVITARTSLYLAVQSWAVSLAFVAWTIWAWWALPLGLAGAMVTYYVRILPAAATYGVLVASCYDVHRNLLYGALRWPPPDNPAREQAAGQRLTAYLVSGSRRPDPAFTELPAPGADSP